MGTARETVIAVGTRSRRPGPGVVRVPHSPGKGQGDFCVSGINRVGEGNVSAVHHQETEEGKQ
ncbi:hypothetical protein [Streptomyces sp. McG3]|uniref:hypothetical protein n=1 Tax=Streptomyces sp. McG3 TaxID=2725483 RepID=UPI001BE6C7A7|nr:hypothetical protein [Streptomyces sp. McG3]MBT2895935.1 hypothetical protein [Streptomyces sp. McG3]